jgi:NAD(P)-dependent dehydrogenase (short-subunit alcohol dehydrogenase family)
MTTALVTGANNAIGKQIARLLVARGATVWVGARSAAKGAEAVAEIGGDARLLILDVTDAASIATAVERVTELDILVNNAGIAGDSRPPGEADADEFRLVYETNVFAVVAVTNAFLPLLRTSPHARIVNISSGTGSLVWSSGPNPQFDHTRTGGGSIAYRSSKTALNAVTLFYAQALTGDGIKVNALAPGLRATNLNARAAAAAGDPAEAAEGAVRLALLDDDGPSGGFFSWDGTSAPW